MDRTTNLIHVCQLLINKFQKHCILVKIRLRRTLIFNDYIFVTFFLCSLLLKKLTPWTIEIKLDLIKLFSSRIGISIFKYCLFLNRFSLKTFLVRDNCIPIILNTNTKINQTVSTFLGWLKSTNKSTKATLCKLKINYTIFNWLSMTHIKRNNTLIAPKITHWLNTLATLCAVNILLDFKYWRPTR